MQGVPSALLHNLKHNKVLHERVVILNIRYAEVPYVRAEDRLMMEQLARASFMSSSATASWMTSTFQRPCRSALRHAVRVDGYHLLLQP